MLPTPTGLIIVALGIWCQFGDYRRTLVSLLILTLFEAASAADLIGLGGASITPAKLFLLFFVLRVVSMRHGAGSLFAEIGPRRVLFIYLLLLIWAVSSAIILPRLFANATWVFSLARADIDGGAILLGPSSGNVTQSVYAIGSFVIAVGTSVLARKPGGYATALTGLLWVTGLDIFMAVLDLVTAATHTSFILDLVHTGSYAFLTSDDVNGLKRISGSFAEASAFASFSLALLAVNLSLFVSGVRPRITSAYSLGLAILLFLSTSSTAYAGLAIFAAAFGAYAAMTLIVTGNARPIKVLAVAGAAGTLVVCLTFLFLPSVIATVGDLLNVMLFQKADSESGVERSSFNTQAIQVFLDTYGLGAGAGSTRTSNYIVLLASNLGIVGLALFALLILALTFARLRSDLSPLDRKIVAAARAGILGTLVPATMIASIFDLGTLFYVLVGIVASSAEAFAPRLRVVEPTGATSAKLAANRRAVSAPAATGQWKTR